MQWQLIEKTARVRKATFQNAQFWTTYFKSHFDYRWTEAGFPQWISKSILEQISLFDAINCLILYQYECSHQATTNPCQMPVQTALSYRTYMHKAYLKPLNGIRYLRIFLNLSINHFLINEEYFTCTKDCLRASAAEVACC